MIRIKQATKKGWIECMEGRVADLAYPTSKTRCGRVQMNGSICPTITASDGGLYRMSKNVYRIRKLTPRECWRLMGFSTVNSDGSWDDKCFEKAESVNSNTQLYKQAGNSIVVDVLYHILGNLIDGEVAEPVEGTHTCPICGERTSGNNICCDKCTLNF